MVKLFYTTYISVDLAHHEIVRAKVGKGDIRVDTIIIFNISSIISKPTRWYGHTAQTQISNLV